MELLFESRLELRAARGKVYFFQRPPALHADPVVQGDTFVDGSGTSIYGSVLRDSGVYRMWYQAWPRDWNGQDVSLVGYAESDDGVVWRKPALGLVHYGGEVNNLCDLGFHSPSVFVDPDAPASHRYRATGCTGSRSLGAHRQATRYGYYTAHSPDGLRWELDSTVPTWDSADVITSVYHPGRRSGVVALKYTPRVRGFRRRSIWNAALKDGRWSSAHAALIPDDFDDVAALGRGFASGDYYGMGMLPAGRGIVGFVWHFRHLLPRTAETNAGVFGQTDVTLAYQADEGDCWVHMPGRPDFISHGALSWAEGGIYTAANVVEAGDEQRLYFCGPARSHGWYLDANWKVLEKRRQQMIGRNHTRISFAHWPRGRIFGWRADPQGELDIDLGIIREPSQLVLNYQAEREGEIRVQLMTEEGYREEREIAGRGPEDARPMTGDSLSTFVHWRDGSVIHPVGGKRIIARLFIECASVYAYDIVKAQ